MTFVEAFYSFSLEVSDTSRSVFGKKRVKIAKHPYEPLSHLYARVIAYVHRFDPQSEISAGLFTPREPAIFERDAIGEYVKWVEVGPLDRKKLERAMKAHPKAEIRIYFDDDEEIARFCHELRGSKTNWIAPLSFYRIPSATLEALTQNERSSATWNVTVIEDYLYLECDGTQIEASIEPLDMWREFQRSLALAQA